MRESRSPERAAATAHSGARLRVVVVIPCLDDAAFLAACRGMVAAAFEGRAG